jgi:hypothetical protein
VKEEAKTLESVADLKHRAWDTNLFGLVEN